MKKNVYTYHMKTANHPPACPTFKRPFSSIYPTSKAGVRFLARPQVGKLVAAVGRQFTVQNPNELYVLVSSALPTTRHDMTCTVLKAT